MTAPLGFHGQTRESGSGYDKQWLQMSKNGVAQNLDGPPVSVTMETGWNTHHSTQDGYRTGGRQLSLAIERFLRTSRSDAPAGRG